MKMLVSLIVSIIFSGFVFANSNVGIVDNNQKDEVCLTIENKDLKKGDKVLVIFPEKPQSVKTAFIQKKVKSSCSRNKMVSEKSSFYLLKMPNVESSWYAFGVTNTTKFRINKGFVNLDINNDGKSEFFRKCVAAEGVLWTIWTGKPLVGKQIWHSYYYLGYDTESTCTKKDG